MGSNWVNALDNCAAGGVLDFDAAAWLIDQPERFVGNPKMEGLPPIQQPLLLPPGIKMQGQLNEDQFDSKSNLVQNPLWKKILFGALAIGGTIAGIIALVKFGRGGKTTGSFGETLKNLGESTWNIIKTPFTWIANKFKGSKPTT
jgi:hypothetical protein